MAKWSELYVQKGVYISKEFDVSSNFDSYIQNIAFEYKSNDGRTIVSIRISYDGSTFGDWIQINDVAVKELFKDDYYSLNSCKFQYKVEMIDDGVVSPEFKSFSYSFEGAYVIENTGDIVCKPEIWITKRNGSGTIKLYNETNGQTLIFTNLNNNEQVYVDCENEDIMTDLPLKYRYDDHNNVFLQLEVGENKLTGEGDFELTIRHEFMMLQG
ncbi:hypothetical protein BSK59_15430 [Paenibacillus odorifer]|uniref:phage distal tail protein n=1 Tax=Paenibacillus odorifer TaxID=189426 RepID=UPI00097AA8E7|nr:phage tail domain-containing protein [Paenibacillus odorifer]OME53971.1 hypothetical protein BSK59_15430 [Paenibacillus odorifer]